MDILTGKKSTIAKIKLLELLASVPYRAWEFRQYERMTSKYKHENIISRATRIMNWSRDSQDKDYEHLIIIHEKMKEDKFKKQLLLKRGLSWEAYIKLLFGFANK